MSTAPPAQGPVLRRGTGHLIVAAALWGTVGLAASVAYRRGGVDPVGLAFWRLAIGGLALTPWLVRAGDGIRRLQRGDRGRIALAGLGLAAYQACFFVAVGLAGVSVATLVALGLAPVLVPLVERFRTRERPSGTTVAATVMAIVGLAGLVGLPARAPEGLLLGVALATVSALGYTTVIVAGKAVGGRLGADRLAMISLPVAAVLLAPVVALTGDLSLGRDPLVILTVLYVGLVPTAFAYWLFFVGLERVSGPTAAVTTLVEPLTATGLAVVLLGEHLTPIGWAGAALLLSAVGLVALGAGRRPGHRTP
jgi:drug/metabolite transporter, DME family